MKEQDSRSIIILMVEDNPDDVELTRQIIKDIKLVNDMQVVEDGVDALKFLRREGEFADAPRPDLILLDINLPKIDGFDVLREIKGDDTLRRIPVIILTSSEDEEDILNAYDLYSNCFITKPVDLDQFARVVHMISDFWLTIVRLPPPV